MTDRAAEDSAPLRPPEAPTAPDPLQRVRAAATEIHQILRANYRDARLPAPGELTFFVVVCSQVAGLAPRWTPQAIGRARKQQKRTRKDLAPKFRRVVPGDATKLPVGHTPATREAIAERAARLRALKIAEVRREVPPPATPPDVPRLPPTQTTVERTRLAAQGPLPHRWAMALRLLAPPLASILLQSGTPVSTGSRSPFTNSCRVLLQFIMLHEKHISVSTDSAAFKKIIVIN